MLSKSKGFIENCRLLSGLETQWCVEVDPPESFFLEVLFEMLL